MFEGLNQKIQGRQLQLAGGLVIAALIVVGGYEYYILRQDFTLVSAEKVELEAKLEESEIENEGLLQETIDQQAIIDSFDDQIRSIGDVVGDLEKLAQTDKELLRKYSKVYFLNENYVPSKLTDIDEEYLLQKDRKLLFHADAWPYLEELLEDAEDDGVPLLVASAFRSFDTQASLKTGYTVLYGAGTANQFSADQGYSEHQLGTTVDFTTAVVGGVFSSFESDPGYKWLLDNAHKYGFVLSYPKGNTYYKFEPWHWRYVGVDLARDLHRDGKNFYDMDQREIDEYLIKLFD